MTAADGSRRPTRSGPVDASMTLLNEVMHRPLDPGYAEAAARREQEGPVRRSRRGVALLAGLAVVLGLTTTAAAVDLRAPQPAVLAARSVLEEEIIDRQARADELADRSAELSAQVETLQAEALAGLSPEIVERLRRDGATTGAQAVHGPGLVVTLDDATRGLAPGEDVDPDAMVKDSDLQRVVNSLWAGGAEAVAINDQRLSTLSAIRSAGDAILVDLQPLVAPYHVRAIGDAEAMQTSLARSGTSDLLRVLGAQYGIASSVTAQSRLELPGRGNAQLFYATVGPPAVDSVPTGPGTPDGGPGTGTGATDSARQENVE